MPNFTYPDVRGLNKTQGLHRMIQFLARYPTDKAELVAQIMALVDHYDKHGPIGNKWMLREAIRLFYDVEAKLMTDGLYPNADFTGQFLPPPRGCPGPQPPPGRGVPDYPVSEERGSKYADGRAEGFHRYQPVQRGEYYWKAGDAVNISWSPCLYGGWEEFQDWKGYR